MFSISVVVIVVLFGTNVQYWDRPGTPIEVLVGHLKRVGERVVHAPGADDHSHGK